ncbi:preprotein translocase subunit SecA [Candidatus Spongiihabitans sp.]|uniref:preprotein translocase subunit SecA n=1 Tax=Candidatus Spongiihabitans sp. TaxID=3101308 RepID=UPI003C7B92EF
MLQNALKKFFGDSNQRLLKKLSKTVDQINALEAGLQALSDDELTARTIEFKARFAKGAHKDELLAETFAVVREASVRALGLRHFDVQLIGGIVLNEGKITEMKTGEGKTLVATLPAYLNAVAGVPVHIVTVNDYLAQRDAEWMGKIYSLLGLSVGVILSGQEREAKKAAYQSDIVYGTNNEFGFDYLRDNMAFSGQDRVQNGLGFGIIDEVDSILIDEARTPLIISGPAEESTDLYNKINTIVPELVKQEQPEGLEYSPGDFSIDEKSRQVALTEEGHEHAEELLAKAGLLEPGSSLYEVANISLMHHLNSALRAINLFNKDVDYIVRDNAIVIIDEFTGRMMPGRRWSEGLHQAVEAKEGVAIQQESQTLASITFQNYFRLYDKLAGMTGTADTEAPEFLQIYGLEVVIIPTNKDMRRDDSADLVYRTADEKYAAICEGIEECRSRSQPVLVGTASIETSEHLSQILKKKGIEHQVLNAKHHGSEAKIIAEAGRPGTITIATNMAGRGTDIVLGGNLEIELGAMDDEDKKQETREQWDKRHSQVIDAGGLHVLGTERNESRRVDNQLRGRCGRQGDPGSSQFFLSLEDNLMRIFGSQKIAGLMEKLGMEEGEAIEHPWVTRAIENAQKKVEGHNFDMRKQLLEYDDVANEQRKVIYEQRNLLMETEDISEYVEDSRAEVVNAVIDRFISPQTLEEQWEIVQLEKEIESEFGAALEIRKWLDEDDSLHQETLRKKILANIIATAQAKENRVGSDSMRHFEKQVMLKVLDDQWKEHLANMDYLRQGIGLRGYAQKNPKQEYKREAFEMFTALLESMKFEVISILAKVHVPSEEEMLEMEQRLRAQQAREQSVKYIHHDATAAGVDEQPGRPSAKSSARSSARRLVSDSAEQPFVRDGKKTGRNEPCPCGSGKKFKQCHGKL